MIVTLGLLAFAIGVNSAYRSPATNAMLANKSSGVADNSQHMRGTAMDFFIPGVPLAKLRAAAMRKQVGGVGYYPTSGSPFVHLDTGSVRAWPRMTRAQLKNLRVYSGSEHPHEAQQPETLDVAALSKKNVRVF